MVVGGPPARSTQAGRGRSDAAILQLRRRAGAEGRQAAMFGKGGSRVVLRELEQAHLTLALEACATDLSLFSLQVFTNTARRRHSSRLFQEVREKRGLCYSIYTFHAPYSDTGFFGLYTGTDPGDAPEMMEVIVDVINDSVETFDRSRGRARQGADEGGLLMGWRAAAPARAAGAPYAGYGRPCRWKSCDPDRRRQRGIDAERGAGLLSRSRPAVVALGSGRGLDTAVAFAEGLTKSMPRRACH